MSNRRFAFAASAYRHSLVYVTFVVVIFVALRASGH